MTDEREVLEWSVFLFARHPGRGLVAVGAVLASAALAWWWFSDPLVVAATLAVLGAALAPYLFPLRYRLDERGVRLKNGLLWDYRPWEKFFDYRVFPDAVQLYFDQRELRGRILKGHLLFFDREGKLNDRIVDMVKRKVRRTKEG
ncbi:MAG: hypothetical protein QME93_02540 [Bacillota bacterium]|nr:hypothetical protein [Bacillota bacterium]MDI7248932.1 hypothetical protein [Bacillota bacterium]